MIKPPRLRVGDMVGIIAPAATVEEEALHKGMQALHQAGFRTAVGKAVFSRQRYLAGSDQQRVDELHRMFQNPEVRGIFCARAGYGSGRLLPLLNVSTVRSGAKVFVGYSDVSALLNFFVQQVGLVSFHGPLVAGELADDPSHRSLDRLLATVMGCAETEVEIPHGIKGGVGEGVLVGGCLSVVVTTLGTPFALHTDGAILFLEDVNEKTYRIDRMLTQLKQAGKFDGLQGVIFGEMAGCGEREEVVEVIEEVFAGYAYPIAFGLPAGHGKNVVTLPLGVRVRLDGERRRLIFLEAPVA